MSNQSIFQVACQIYNESTDDETVRDDILMALIEDNELCQAALKYAATELEKFARSRARQRAERSLRHGAAKHSTPGIASARIRAVVEVINEVASLLDSPLVYTAVRLRDARYSDIEFAHNKSLLQIGRGTQNAAFTAGLLSKMEPTRKSGKTIGQVLSEDEVRELQIHAMQVGDRTLHMWEEDEVPA